MLEPLGRPLVCPAALLATAMACTPGGSGVTGTESIRAGGETAQLARPVVYGDDDRLEYFELDESQRPALEAAAAFIDRWDIIDEEGRTTYDADSLADDDGVCPDEAFADQPTASGCSSALIDDQLLISAGHCVDDGLCPEEKFVFGYWYTAPGELKRVTDDDVYTCRRVVAHVDDEDNDFAVVQLDRPVTAAAPLAVNTTPVALDDPLTLVGFPDQLPGKYSPNGRVIGLDWSGDNAFGGTVDAFGGNSGSAVLDGDGAVVGILVAGEDDYEWDAISHCYRVAVLPEDGGEDTGETITAIGPVIAALCDTGYPSETLCGQAAACGDGFCTGSEDMESCADDCTPGPGIPPPGWTCDAGFFFVGDDCDCDCGVYDPDCDDPGLDVYGCPDAFLCNGDGRCYHPNVPAAWDCDDDWYEADDDCDCDCGAYDPDCDDPELDILNCERGQICGSDGTCTEPDLPPEPEPDAGDATADVGGETDAAADVTSETGDAAEPDTSASSDVVTVTTSGARDGCSAATSHPPRTLGLWMAAAGALGRRSRGGARRSDAGG